MSKADAKALEEIRTALKSDAADAPADAICTLVGEGLGFLERIALALEEGAKPSIALAGEGTIIGEIAKFEPLISPELAARLVVALEAIAAKAPA